MDADEDPAPPTYVLGHSAHELKRLRRQAGIVGSITRQFFLEAGIADGMRVLDVGSGGGDVSMLLAEIVGPSGEVVGVDTSTSAVEAARARLADLGLGNVSFVHGDPAGLQFERSFDAVAGRFVLQFIADPVATIRAVGERLRPGGIIVFHEIEWDALMPQPPSPTYAQASAWGRAAIAGSGASIHSGGQLGRALVAAGFPNPQLRLEAPIAVGEAAEDVIHWTCDLVRTLLPTIERLGIAAAAEVDIDTLADRISAEVRELGCVIVGRTQIGGWSQRP